MKGEVETQFSLSGLLLHTQPLHSSEQHTRAHLEFSSHFAFLHLFTFLYLQKSGGPWPPGPAASGAPDLIKVLWHIESWDFHKRKKKKKKIRKQTSDYAWILNVIWLGNLACDDKLCAQWVKVFSGATLQILFNIKFI